MKETGKASDDKFKNAEKAEREKKSSNSKTENKNKDESGAISGIKGEIKAKKILEKAAPLAAKTLVSIMTDENSSNSLKADCAKEILTRIYGKTFEEEQQSDLSAFISDSVAKFCV